MTNPTPNWNIILPMMLLAGAGLWAVLWLIIADNITKRFFKKVNP